MIYRAEKIHCLSGRVLSSHLIRERIFKDTSHSSHSLTLCVEDWRISGGGGSSNIVVTGCLPSHCAGKMICGDWRREREPRGYRLRHVELYAPPAMIVITGSVSPRQLLSLTTTNIVSTSSQLSSICDINLAFHHWEDYSLRILLGRKSLK